MRKGVWHGLLTGLALLLAACGGGSQPQPDLTLAGVSPDSPAVVQGGTVTLTLTFTSQNGFQGQVSLSVTENGQPPSWLTLSPPSATLNVPKGGQAQVSLQVRVAGNAPTGPHALKLRASYGDKVAERDLTLTVNAPPDFTISLNPTSLTVQQGGSGTTRLTLTPQGGFTGTVNLSLVGAPPGITLSPTSLEVAGPSPVTQDLTIQVGAEVAPGTYSLRVRGTSGSLTGEADLALTVTARARVTITMDWSPLVQAASISGQQGPITLTGTLEGTPTAPLRLQLSYRPREGDWGPWEDAAGVQVQGSQVTATIPDPGLALPRGLDELGKGVRARVVMGDEVLQTSPGIEISRFHPIWAATWSHPGAEYHASEAALCGYGITDWGAPASRVLCWDPEDGHLLAQADLTGFRIYDVFVSPEGRVYLAGAVKVGDRFEPAVRAYASPGALGTGAHTEIRLSGTFDHVTAVAAEGDDLYVGGNRWVQVSEGRCYARFMRIRLAKYRLSGFGATLVSLHDPTPQDLQEIDLARYFPRCDLYAPLNSTSIPLLRLDGDKLYAVFVHTVNIYLFSSGRHVPIETACLGFMRFDTATFRREWLDLPRRPGANGEERSSGGCDGGDDMRTRDRALRIRWYLFYFNNENPPCGFYDCHAVVFSYGEFDIGDTYLYAAELFEPETRKAKLLRKEDGQGVVTAARSSPFIFTGSGSQIVSPFRAPGDPFRFAGVVLGTYESGSSRAYKVEGIRLPQDSEIAYLLRAGNKVYLTAPSAEGGGWVVRLR